MEQLSLAVGTEHVCPKCKQTYRCDEDSPCDAPRETECGDCMKKRLPWASHHITAHSSWGGNQAKHDPVWAAKLARIMARQRSYSTPVVIAESSPCDLTKLDINS